MTDNGLAALAARLTAQDIGCMKPVAVCDPPDPRYADFHPAAAVAILGERGVFLADGWPTGYVPVRLYSGGVLADGTTNTEPIDFLNPPAPDYPEAATIATLRETLDSERAECVRLRAALDECRRLADPGTESVAPTDGRGQRLNWIWKTARAALTAAKEVNDA
jgi:hypothetical protein